MTISTVSTVTPADVAEVTVAPVPASRPMGNAGRKAVADLKKAREAKKKAEADIKDAEARVWEALAGARKGTLAGMTIVRVQPGSNSHFDREVLKAAFPEAYKASYRETHYESLRVL